MTISRSRYEWRLSVSRTANTLGQAFCDHALTATAVVGWAAIPVHLAVCYVLMSLYCPPAYTGLYCTHDASVRDLSIDLGVDSQPRREISHRDI
jgi:hypothetical protein